MITINKKTFEIETNQKYIAKGKDFVVDHDDTACREKCKNKELDKIFLMTFENTLVNYLNLTCDQAKIVMRYFDFETWSFDHMKKWEWDGCKKYDCEFNFVSIN